MPKIPQANLAELPKTGAAFIDLSAAYDTVWHDDLMLKLARIFPCKKMLGLISSMTGTRRFFL